MRPASRPMYSSCNAEGHALTVEGVTGLLGVLVWPAVLPIASARLRRELPGLFGRARKIEGRGSEGQARSEHGRADQ
jgi:hypothetical protein